MSTQRAWSPSTGPLPIGGSMPSSSLGGRVPRSYYLAHWWPRVGATLLDGLVVAPVNIALALSFHLFTVTHQLNASGTSVPRLQYHPYVFLLFALVYMLYTVILICRDGEHNGQTLGKQWVGLRVIRNDGEPVDLKTALMREGLVKTLPGVIGSLSALVGVATSFFSLLDDLWPLRGNENQAIHDLVAETHVVQTKQQPAYAPGAGASEPSRVSTPSANEPPPTGHPTGLSPVGHPTALPTGLSPIADASSTLLREVPIGTNGYLALRDIARDRFGACWIDPAAPVQSVPDNVHVVRVSNAPEGLFVSLSVAYESLLASNPYEPAEHGQPGWRRATLSIS
jgi:uncharacterized RDD family membrane protein YckC